MARRLGLRRGQDRHGLRWPTWLAMALVVALVASLAGFIAFRDYISGTRADARAAVEALRDGDLVALDERLAEHRGEPGFAYFFTSKATPRELGDALATVAGPSKDQPLREGIDTASYELTLTDLAGTLALATHGTGQLSLPLSWTSQFVQATTSPATLAQGQGGSADSDAKLREKQDLANRSNLLLLLSRGYWSKDFLQTVTRAYCDYDRREGDSAWPTAEPAKDVGYAPAPNGAYLTDGVVALTAALTANPAAAEWAFTEFLPNSVKIDGSDYRIGAFTHYLMFEHRYSESADGEGIGVTTALTALSSAVDSANWAAEPAAAASLDASSDDFGPVHDALVLEAVAKDLTAKSGCSWNPLDYGHCLVDAAKAVWHWLQHWGHIVLDILTLATFAPPPFSVVGAPVGVAAAATNATWYAIEGDYGAAGLSLAAAVPGLAYLKIAKAAKAGAAAEKLAAESDNVAKAANEIRAGADAAEQRVTLGGGAKQAIMDKAPKDAYGNYIDPNTGKIIPHDGPYNVGHKPGYEWRCIQAKARREGWSRLQLIAYANDPSLYQIEDPTSNKSHLFEADTCAI